MIGKYGFRVVSILLVLVSALAFTMSASATGELVKIESFNQTLCTPGLWPVGSVTHENGTAAVAIRFSLTNHSKGTTSSWMSGLLPSGTYTFDVQVPGNTAEGDSMMLAIDLLDSGGGVLISAYRDYACGTGEGPGLDMGQNLSGAVVGRFVANTAIMQEPGVVLHPEVVMEVGKTLWVLGVDETGMYYKVLLSGQPFWVPVGSMGPNFDEVWNGTPLPTTTVY